MKSCRKKRKTKKKKKKKKVDDGLRVLMKRKV